MRSASSGATNSATVPLRCSLMRHIRPHFFAAHSCDRRHRCIDEPCGRANRIAAAGTTRPPHPMPSATSRASADRSARSTVRSRGLGQTHSNARGPRTRHKEQRVIAVARTRCSMKIPRTCASLCGHVAVVAAAAVQAICLAVEKRNVIRTRRLAAQLRAFRRAAAVRDD